MGKVFSAICGEREEDSSQSNFAKRQKTRLVSDQEVNEIKKKWTQFNDQSSLENENKKFESKVHKVNKYKEQQSE